jgi:PAS domain S-box-containing protein
MTHSYEEMSREELVALLRALQADPRLQATSSGTERLIHDLQVHQLELEMQNRELREAQHLLEEARSRYVELYDFAPVVYVTLDRNGRILEANLTAAALFGVERGALVGLPLLSLVSIESQQRFLAHVRKCVTEQVRVTGELTFSIPGVGPSVAQVVSTPALGPDGAITGCKTTLTDVSALKRSEELLRLLSRVSATLASSFDYAATLAASVRLVVPTFADICFVDVLDGDGQLARVGVAFADPGKQHLVALVRGLAPPATGNAPQAHVLRAREPILLAEATAAGLRQAVAEGVEHEALIRACRARSLMFVPLLARERTLGVITFVMAESGRRYAAADLVLAQDLAARAAMAIDNAHLYAEAQKAIAAREDVLSIVSHDLKNPLSIIVLSAMLLLQSAAQPEAPKRQRQLESIQRAAGQMQRIIDDLLDVASIESGQLSVELGVHPLEELVRDACEALLPLAAQKGLALDLDRRAGPCEVLCDRGRILQVFSNLVGNAIKFTPTGGAITIRVERHAEVVRVAVQDTGPGIPEALLPHIFKRHWQARKYAKAGLGLGLHITRGIVEAQGGTIWAESQPGAGTTVFFTMPLAAPARGKQDDVHARNP